MKKYKYQRLTKEEKKDAKEKFYQTELGINLKQKFKRILIYSIALIIFGIFLIINTYIKKDSNINYIYASLLIIFGIFFLIARRYVIIIKVNDFITKKPPKK